MTTFTLVKCNPQPVEYGTRDVPVFEDGFATYNLLVDGKQVNDGDFVLSDEEAAQLQSLLNSTKQEKKSSLCNCGSSSRKLKEHTPECEWRQLGERLSEVLDIRMEE